MLCRFVARFAPGITTIALLLISVTIGHTQSTYQGGFHEPGVDGAVFTIRQFLSSEVWVGGNYSVVTGTGEVTEDFAVYDLDEKFWTDLGFDSVMTGTFTWVNDIDAFEGKYLVAGRFTNGDGSITNIATFTRFSGLDWQPLTANDDQTNGEILDVYVENGDVLYAAGKFTEIGGVTALRVARYDGTNGWQPLGDGLGFDPGLSEEEVHALAFHDGRLYAAGYFRDPDNDDFSRYESVAVWDGQSWEYLGEGIGGSDPMVYDLLVEADTVSGGDQVFIAGEFRWVNGLSTETDTVTSFGVAAYHTADSTWQAYDLASAPSWADVRSIERINDRLLIGGQWLIDTAPSITSGLAVWNETTARWENWGYGIPSGLVRDISMGMQGRLWVGGDFERIGTIDGLVSGAPRWVSSLTYRDSAFTDSTWFPIGEGVATAGGSRSIREFSLQIDEITGDTNVVVGGGFDVIGGMIANGLAVRTDTGWYAWPDFPSGNGSVYSVDVNGDSILVAGTDLMPGLGDPKDYLAVWDGNSWNDVGGGPGYSVAIQAAFDTNGDIIVAGAFDNGVGYDQLLRWDGVQWNGFLSHASSSPIITTLERHPTADTMFVAGAIPSAVGILEDTSVAPLGGDANPWLSGAWTQSVTALLPTAYGLYMGLSRVNPSDNLLSFWRYGEDNGWRSYSDTLFEACYSEMRALEQTVGCEILLGGTNGGPNSFNCSLVQGILSYDQGFAEAGGLFGLGKYVEDMIRVGDEVWIGGGFDNIAGIPSSDLAVLQLSTDSLASNPVRWTNAPAKDTVLNYGEEFHIDWEYADSIPRTVILEVSLDSGLTWTEIETPSLQTNALEFGRWWLVPDTTAQSCLLRVSDQELPCNNATSNLFSIQTDPGLTVEWLTRGALNTPHPEPYVPAHDDWSFSNAERFMWPEVAWRDFDYSGFVYSPDNDVFPSWERYCDAFGRDHCYTSGVAGIGSNEYADPVAYAEWLVVSKEWNGSCFGFALTALRTFAGLGLGFLPGPEAPHLDTLWQARESYNSEDSTRQIRAIVRNTINRWFCYELTLEHAVIVAEHAGVLDILPAIEGSGDLPMETLQQIREDWSEVGGALNARVLALWDRSNFSRAHAVLPYKIVNHQDSAHIYQLFIYDSNRPGGDTLHIRIDSILDTWEYALEAFERDSSGTVVDTLDRGWDPSHDGLFTLKKVTEYGSTALDGQGRIHTSRPVATTLRNDTTSLFAMARVEPSYDILFVSDSGDTTGYRNGGVIWQSKNTAPIFPLSSLYEGGYPLSYLMPDSSRTITISNAADSAIRFGWVSDDAALTYRRFDAAPSETDGLVVDSGLGVFNPDPGSRTVILEAATTNSATGRLARLSEVSLVQDDTLGLALDSTGVVTIDNPGSEKTIGMLFWGSDGATGDQFVEATDITIEADARYRIPLDWVDLDGGQQMELDRGRDGSVDETLPLVVVTEIEDNSGGDALPDDYSLSQNYPNPFNPSTRIDFSVPKRGTVTLEILNIRGQRVKTLINKKLAAGQYSVEWKGRNGAGQPVATGVYFYRLMTEDYTASKKMLLLK